MKKIFAMIFVISLSGCDGIIMNHYASRSHQPLDGSTFRKTYEIDDYRYPSGNLQYLKDRKKRDNNLYFASSRRYNELNYEVTQSYLNYYNKYLKVDTKELDQRVKEQNKYTNGKTMLDAMEYGILPIHPLKNNIIAMQTLKDEDEKIAIPDYLSEYFDIYENNKDKTESIQTEVVESGQAYPVLAYNTETRDKYVERYLSWNDDYASENREFYKEKPLY